ncbi:hypothetical protein AAG565_14980 [Fontimonas sp. SYSU GA230001]|uniref:hypothetical protein n=1 Tax=Fontimonas sp. SYSU GA230001 TaxID=3142450 RepID=UPI0032B38747
MTTDYARVRAPRSAALGYMIGRSRRLLIHSDRGTRLAVTIKTGSRQDVVMFVDFIDSMTIISLPSKGTGIVFAAFPQACAAAPACIHTVIHKL